MTTEQMIEEALTKHRKILAEATTFDEMAVKTEKLIREALTTIATKSAEEEREYATKNVTRIIMEWGKEYKISMQLQTYLLGAMLNLYKSKDTNEEN